MKKMRQTNTAVPGGDCLRTCVACVLDMDSPEDVPNFVEDDVEPPYQWWDRMNDWLAERDMRAVLANFENIEASFAIPGLCLLGVETSNPDSPSSSEGLDPSDSGKMRCYISP